MRRVPIFIIAGFALVILSATAEGADEWDSYAEVVCAPAQDIAIARFAAGPVDEPPAYALLPPEIDGGLSSSRVTGATSCETSAGHELRVRQGMEQMFPYGMGGADAPSFFSLWFDRRKVLSHRGFSPTDRGQPVEPVVAVVMNGYRMTVCTHPAGEDEGKVECRAEPGDNASLPIDVAEYPPDDVVLPKAGSTIITTGRDNPLCRAFVVHNPAGVDEITRPASPIAGDPEQYFNAVMQDAFDVNTGMVSVPTSALDFDGDGVDDTVVWFQGSTHYFDGSQWIVAPASVTTADVIRGLDPNDNDHDMLAKAAKLGWHVYGGRPAGPLRGCLAPLRPSRSSADRQSDLPAGHPDQSGP